MTNQEDKKWLKKVLKECFDNSNDKPGKNEQLLEGFSMLARNMVKNMQKNLNEIRALWEKDPASEELREKFDLLTRCLFYLERYCREKISHEFPKE